MEWFVFAAPVPGVLELSVKTGLVWVVGLLAVFTPVALVVRHAFGLGSIDATATQLRVVEGGKELDRRAA